MNPQDFEKLPTTDIEGVILLSGLLPANDALEYYNQQYGMRNAWFRFLIVLGVGSHGYYSVDGVQKKSGFQIFLENALEGKNIAVYGDSETVRDVVYVKDVAEVFYKAIQRELTSGLCNITSSRKLALKDQAEIMADVFQNDKKSAVVLKSEVNNRSKSFWLSTKKTKKDFGYDSKFADFKL